ncbi:LacI family DNA-binding transcriptional regulator [Asticcacaulis sp.]|uniref:LacI family DNA-binding transcriptional regulator n=1 Tax=Asticcacaulis sp. TaxID=1872648 RepID=UPI002BC75E28|nr:LacI family DNA-binding transcriptional regulator [Asticcacaulis sp.]HTM81539.1 LacI family DNA-binding transcriptional regulator [Asticcacaulis sp.]
MKKLSALKPNIVDVARQAGVSTATVDRVLNNRPGVHPRTQTHVFQIAEELGYIAHAPGGGQFELTFDFIMPGENNAFMQRLGEELLQLSLRHARLPKIRLHWLDDYAPEKVTARIEKVRHDTQGIGLIALDNIGVRENLLTLIASKIPVITLATDISGIPHQGYVGTDNRMNGRLAGHLIGRFLDKSPHNIALFSGALAYRGHEEREMGFRHILADEYPHLTLLRTQEVRENDDMAFQILSDMVRSEAKFSAVYSIGYGSMGIARALVEMGLARDVVFVAHELHPESRKYLIDGTIDALIDAHPRIMAEQAIERLVAAATSQPLAPLMPTDTRIILKENVPAK